MSEEEEVELTDLNESDLEECKKALSEAATLEDEHLESSPMAAWAEEWGADLLFTLEIAFAMKKRYTASLRHQTEAINLCGKMVRRLGKLFEEGRRSTVAKRKIRGVFMKALAPMYRQVFLGEASLIHDDEKLKEEYVVSRSEEVIRLIEGAKKTETAPEPVDTTAN